MTSKRIFLGFVPWIVFSVIATRGGAGAVGVAALLAFAVAVFLVGRSVSRGESAKLLEVTATATFALIGAWSLASPASDQFLAAYGRGLATLLLAGVILVTLPVRPFTVQYARESVPREYWNSTRFRRVNLRISAAWGGAVAAMAVGHLVAGALAATAAGPRAWATPEPRPANLLLNWVVPALIVLATIRYTNRVISDSGGVEDRQRDPEPRRSEPRA